MYQNQPQTPYGRNPNAYPPQPYGAAPQYGQAQGAPADQYYGDGQFADPAMVAHAGDLSNPAVAAFARKVYLYFATSLATAMAAAFGGTLTVDHFIAQNNPGAVNGLWLGGMITFFVSYLVVVFTRKSHSPLKTALLYVFAGSAGAMLAPLLMAHVASGMGMAIVLALGVATVTFFGLTVYTFTTGKDFRGLGSYLFAGVLVLIGFILISMFVPFSSPLQMVLMGAGMLLFVGFTLFDTSRVVRDYYVANDAVSAAINLLYDFIMLFRYALYFLGSSRN